MPIPLRPDFTATQVHAVARRSKDGPQARRLLALAAIYDGASWTEVARIGGVTLQIVRDWVLRFNARGPDALIDRKPPGQPARLTDDDRTAVAAMIESGPISSVHGVDGSRPRHLSAKVSCLRATRLEEPPAMDVTTIGIYLAKHVFQVHGVDVAGGVVIRKALRRAQVLPFFAKLAPCLVGMEACGTSPH